MRVFPFIQIFVLLIVLLAVHPAFSSEKGLKFNKIPDDLVKMKVYSEDPEAEALVLSHTGEVQFIYRQTKGFLISYKIHKVIKILDKEGTSFGDHEIPYYDIKGRVDGVSSIKGYVYNEENGEIIKTKITKAHIFDEEVSKTYRKKKISAPQVKVGSVVEIQYEIQSDLISYIREWEFQSTIPTLWSEYHIEYPEYFSYSQNSQGFNKYVINDHSSGVGNLTITEKGSSSQLVNFQTRINHWAVENAPALREDFLIDNPMSYANKVEFQLQWVHYPNSRRQNIAASWNSFNEELLKDRDFGKYLEKSKPISLVVEEVIKNANSEKEKLALITEHLQQNVKWNGERGIYPTQNLQKTYKDGEGSVADINFLLIAFLKAAGIEAHPVVSSTRDRGFLNPSNPVTHKLNYVSAWTKIEGVERVVDLTDQFLATDFLPIKAINMRGWLVSENDRAGWVEMKNSTYNTEISSIVLEFTPEGLRSSVSKSYLGYKAKGIRESIKSSGEEKHLISLRDSRTDWDFEGLNFENIYEKEKPLSEKYIITNGSINTDSEIIYLNPFNSGELAVNPFQKESREYPIDFIYQQRKKVAVSIQIPEGYKIESLPQSIRASLPDQEISFSYHCASVNDSMVQVLFNFHVNNTVFSPTSYDQVKAIFETLTNTQNEVIVLKKI